MKHTETGELAVLTQVDLGGAWQTWTPRITQSGVDVAATIGLAQYKIDYAGLCHVQVHLTMTGAGVANAIYVRDMPTVIYALSTLSNLVLGHGFIKDTATPVYAVAVVQVASDIWAFVGYNTAGYMGSSPSFALAATDVISFNLAYRVV